MRAWRHYFPGFNRDARGWDKLSGEQRAAIIRESGWDRSKCAAVDWQVVAADGTTGAEVSTTGTREYSAHAMETFDQALHGELEIKRRS